ncbi:hypothetical protein L3Q82_012790 [Scortum barcoo]|uniref:Uncharacterized protein n=1 Tax=Scortum barcoo TaxID=214431 RepID=A0ACB8W434_9TELE|nr:hypothetical protein L3Q82_012790 [Scortum barcoo]
MAIQVSRPSSQQPGPVSHEQTESRGNRHRTRGQRQKAEAFTRGRDEAGWSKTGKVGSPGVPQMLQYKHSARFRLREARASCLMLRIITVKKTLLDSEQFDINSLDYKVSAQTVFRYHQKEKKYSIFNLSKSGNKEDRRAAGKMKRQETPQSLGGPAARDLNIVLIHVISFLHHSPLIRPPTLSSVAPLCPSPVFPLSPPATATERRPAEYKRHLSTTSNSQTPNSTMAKTKELSKDTRNKIVDLHQAGKD